jgi:radical SAM protein with 4Fe4S-binding SPASM domain
MNTNFFPIVSNCNVGKHTILLLKLHGLFPSLLKAFSLMRIQLNDLRNLISKITFRKGWNALKLFTGYFYSRLTQTSVNIGLPASISFEPTTSCNLRCPECPSGLRSFSRATGMLDPEFFKRTIDELQQELLYLTFYFQGEPFLHPQFTEMIQYASQKKIYTATSTNAHFLNDETSRKTIESGLDRLIVSIDGTTQETYEQYRIGGSLEKALTGARNVVKWKKFLKSKTPHVIFQFLVVRQNEHQLNDFMKLAIETGADDFVFKTAQVYNYESGNDLIPMQEKYSRYKKNSDGTWRTKNKLLNHCWKMWHSCVITWDGKIVPCCFDKDARHVMGDLQTKRFSEIWNSESYQQFRSSLLKSRSEIDICKNCTEGIKASVSW